MKLTFLVFTEFKSGVINFGCKQLKPIATSWELFDQNFSTALANVSP
jgi:hypothetical protein